MPVVAATTAAAGGQIAAVAIIGAVATGLAGLVGAGGIAATQYVSSTDKENRFGIVDTFKDKIAGFKSKIFGANQPEKGADWFPLVIVVAALVSVGLLIYNTVKK